MDKGKKLIRGIIKGAGILILAVLFLYGALTIISFLENGNVENKYEAADSKTWMSKLSDELLLSEINIPGTHDSATQYVQLSFFSKCQGQNIQQQLEDGFRYLDIRLGEVEENGQKSFVMMHGFTKCKMSWVPWSRNYDLDTVIDQCENFLSHFQNETIVFMVKYENGNMSIAEVENLLDSYVKQRENLFLLTDTIPTLGEARGKIVLVRRYEDEAGLGMRAGLEADWAKQNSSEVVSPALEPFANEKLTTYVQDHYKYSKDNKWNAFEQAIEKAQELDASDTICINFLSTNGTLIYGHPYFYAKSLNERLKERNFTSEERLGWVIVDFGNGYLAQKIYETNSELYSN